jgi:hypothetical protein
MRTRCQRVAEPCRFLTSASSLRLRTARTAMRKANRRLPRRCGGAHASSAIRWRHREDRTMRPMKSLLTSFAVCSALAAGATLAQTTPAPAPTPTPSTTPTTPHSVPPHTPPSSTAPRAPLPGTTPTPPGTLPVPGSNTRVPQTSPQQSEELQQQQNLHNQVNDNANSSMQRNGKQPAQPTQPTNPMINPASSSTSH